MTTFPAASYLSNAGRQKGEMKTGFEDFLAATKQIPGAGVAESTLTIASGAVTPTLGVHAVDTEAAAAADDLTTITATNLPDGSFLWLRCVSAARVVTVKHLAGGAGQISLKAAADLALSATTTWLLLKRTGALWEELGTFSATAATGMPRNHRAGCKVSNNGSDAVNDIDIAVGAWRDSTDVADIILTGALTKRLDAAWAVGTNQGMRASGAAIADTTYHIFLIKRPDTGVVDIAADTSVTGANIAANTNAAYTLKRRIRSIRRVAGTIVAEVQDGLFIQPLASTLDVSDNSNPGTGAVTRTLSVPLGINVIARMVVMLIDSASAPNGVVMSDLATNDETSNERAVAACPAIGAIGQAMVDIRTNTSSQIRSRLRTSTGTLTFSIRMLAYFDYQLDEGI